jgi:hypothetical protein
VAVVVPDNGYLDSVGSGWRCERGFHRDASACVAMVLPANAHVDFTGNDWSCSEGFRKEGKGCLTRN